MKIFSSSSKSYTHEDRAASNDLCELKDLEDICAPAGLRVHENESIIPDDFRNLKD